ncbi:unnamed protein product [Nesidiocoris tenuis]|uniref:Uncharacterized protein n=1 Tax=Nesidiocoris tenuis TaxID=355587 RepID=A0A6H5GLR0_9HEMI|nr:unnamed protein product [Nesidiocoris tenuis]
MIQIFSFEGCKNNFECTMQRSKKGKTPILQHLSESAAPNRCFDGDGPANANFAGCSALYAFGAKSHRPPVLSRAIVRPADSAGGIPPSGTSQQLWVTHSSQLIKKRTRRNSIIQHFNGVDLTSMFTSLSSTSSYVHQVLWFPKKSSANQGTLHLGTTFNMYLPPKYTREKQDTYPDPLSFRSLMAVWSKVETRNGLSSINIPYDLPDGTPSIVASCTAASIANQMRWYVKTRFRRRWDICAKKTQQFPFQRIRGEFPLGLQSHTRTAPIPPRRSCIENGKVI